MPKWTVVSLQWEFALSSKTKKLKTYIHKNVIDYIWFVKSWNITDMPKWNMLNSMWYIGGHWTLWINYQIVSCIVQETAWY